MIRKTWRPAIVPAFLVAWGRGRRKLHATCRWFGIPKSTHIGPCWIQLSMHVSAFRQQQIWTRPLRTSEEVRRLYTRQPKLIGNNVRRHHCLVAEDAIEQTWRAEFSTLSIIMRCITMLTSLVHKDHTGSWRWGHVCELVHSKLTHPRNEKRNLNITRANMVNSILSWCHPLPEQRPRQL